MTEKYILYIDDTGSRDPDKYSAGRTDGMDCFGLGGILIKEEDVEGLVQKHKAFCAEWEIDYPLHSSRIRGGHGKFGWLKKPENAGLFFPALQDFLLSLPVIGIAAVVHRPGYVTRYESKYDRLWYMCKTTFCILVERAAKFSEESGRKLEVFFEESGKKEDRDLILYMRALKREGNPFDQENSGGYRPLGAEDYRRIILGEPQRQTKKSAPIQIADLMLYPIAKGGYDPAYQPYQKLKEHGKLVDCLVPEEEIPLRGIKYSCFDDHKQ